MGSKLSHPKTAIALRPGCGGSEYGVVGRYSHRSRAVSPGESIGLRSSLAGSDRISERRRPLRSHGSGARFSPGGSGPLSCHGFRRSDTLSASAGSLGNHGLSLRFNISHGVRDNRRWMASRPDLRLDAVHYSSLARTMVDVLDRRAFYSVDSRFCLRQASGRFADHRLFPIARDANGCSCGDSRPVSDKPVDAPGMARRVVPPDLVVPLRVGTDHAPRRLPNSSRAHSLAPPRGVACFFVRLHPADAVSV